ncbi:MAG: hypothetical protein IJD48_03970 [Clostridia bacterium]|nr:hypothetical protein [Clostridia bacterium]
MNYNQNQKALEALQEGYDKCWDIFLYGDKESGTKPGNIYVYGAIVGQREVAKARMKTMEQNSQNSKEM